MAYINWKLILIENVKNNECEKIVFIVNKIQYV